MGKDKKGIIATVSAALAERQANILDISQTILQDFFTMIMIVDLTDCPLDFVTLRDEMGQIGSNDRCGDLLSARRYFPIHAQNLSQST